MRRCIAEGLHVPQLCEGSALVAWPTPVLDMLALHSDRPWPAIYVAVSFHCMPRVECKMTCDCHGVTSAASR